MSTVRDDATT